MMADFRITIEINHSVMTHEDEISNNRRGYITAILLIGCCNGALIGGQASNRFSRKYPISAFSFMLVFTSAMQTASCWFAFILVARFFAG